MEEITEKEIVAHVTKSGRFVSSLVCTGEPYTVDYKGISYYASGTRELVEKICKDEGIKVK